MSSVHDGPSSSLFRPLALDGNTDLDLLSGDPAPALNLGMTQEMATALSEAPRGACTAWGIPFEVDRPVLLAGQPVTVELAPVRSRWLVFMHTSDVRPLAPHPSGIISPMRGAGQLAEHAADYVMRYEDGSEARVSLRRRYELGAFRRRWGENCFAAVADHKPFPLSAHHDGPLSSDKPWGWRITRVSPADSGRAGSGTWVNWLWAWENPQPEKAICALRFEPGAGVVLLSAVSAGAVASSPLRWRSRRKARLVLAPGEAVNRVPDGEGLLEQVQLDLGQVISAVPRPFYPTDGWPGGHDNEPPESSPTEILLEYTSHEEAHFHVTTGSAPRVIPVRAVEAGSDDRLSPVAAAEKTVHVRIVDAGSRLPVPVKLHIHGAAGEYLPPVDRHRIINPGFFEDYSVDFGHVVDWEDLGRMHPCSYVRGETLVKLPLGAVYVEVSKGFEIWPVRQVVEVGPETETIEIEVEKVLPWREKGWITADTHVHFLSPVSAMLEGAAEGVNVINLLASQWGELMTNVGDFDGQNTWGSRAAGGDGEYLVRVGTENRQHVLGHISLLGYEGSVIAPMTTGGPDESALGDPVEALLTEWARQCRRQGGLVVVPHFPNPRAEHAAAIVSGDVDAIEMTSWEDHYYGIDPYSLSDWYRYLNCGYQVAAVGGTDKMTAATAVGTVRTYARLPLGAEFTYEAWKDAVRRGETFVTYGPLLEFLVDGRPAGTQIAMDSHGGTVDVTWEASSVTVPMSRVELIVNGEIRESVGVGSRDASGSWHVRLDRSSWLAILVRGHYPGKPEIIVAHSSSVFVLVDDSPLLAAADAVTILDQIEGAMVYLDTIGTRATERAYKRMRLELDSAYRALHRRMHEEGHFHEHSGGPAH